MKHCMQKYLRSLFIVIFFHFSLYFKQIFVFIHVYYYSELKLDFFFHVFSFFSLLRKLVQVDVLVVSRLQDAYL